MDYTERYIETTRFERKYRCTYNQYISVRNSLYPYLKIDPFTHKAPGRKYLVRSLYFDTYNYHLFLEKIGGNSNRTKFRIRTYGISPQDHPDIRAEIKVRQANQTMKYGTYITLDDCNNFLTNRRWDNRNNPILVEFERQARLLNLQQKTLVEYRREGYHTRDGNDIRITFDHNIKSAYTNHLFPEKVFWHVSHAQMIVMEIKHQGTIPGWLNQVIKKHGLRLVSNSKFVFGIQSSCPDIIHTGWSHS